METYQNHTRPTGIPERFLNIKVGDVLVIRELTEMREEFGRNWQNVVRCAWNSDMNSLCGEEYIVTQNMLDRINANRDSIVTSHYGRFEISLDMLKPKNFIKAELTIDESNPKEEPYNFNASIIKTTKDEKTIKKMISMVDKKRFTKLLAVAGSGDYFKKMPEQSMVEKYLRQWAEAKYEYYILFGEKLWIEKDIEVDVTNEEMTILRNELGKKYPKYALLLERFTSNEFINNKMENDDKLRTLFPRYFSTGGKLTKFLSQALEDSTFDIELSKIIQSTKVKGKIVVSIDPYDYLTMSLNMHSWRSCHCLKDGEYATGCVSYMIDESTLIAYRHSDKVYEYDELGFKFSGNSKAWRQCVYFDKDSCSMIFGRQYPSLSVDVSKEIRYLLEENVSTYVGQDNKWTVKSNEFDGKFEDLYNFHYSDVENGNDFKFARFKFLKNPAKVHFKVGAQIYCVYSGNELSESQECVRDYEWEEKESNNDDVDVGSENTTESVVGLENDFRPIFALRNTFASLNNFTTN